MLLMLMMEYCRSASDVNVHEKVFQPELRSDYFFTETPSPSDKECNCEAFIDTSRQSSAESSESTTNGQQQKQIHKPACMVNYPSPVEECRENMDRGTMSVPSTPNHAAALKTRNALNDPNAEYVGPFKLGTILGRGCTGIVRIGTHKRTGFKVAFKIIEKRYLEQVEKLWKKAKREIAILKLVEHPHVLKLYDVLETENKLYLVLEYVKGGELFDYIVSKGKLDRHESLRLIAQIVMGLEHCHQHRICHRDLKPENLLLDENKNIKIADFGMAQLIKDRQLRTSCGSPHYASPEIIEGAGYDATKTDVWSIGVILYALITGSLPFDHENITALLRMVCKGRYTTPSFVPHDVSDLISRMLTVDPNKRIKLEHIRDHPAFNGNAYFYLPLSRSSRARSKDDFTSATDEDVIVDGRKRRHSHMVYAPKRLHAASMDSALQTEFSQTETSKACSTSTDSEDDVEDQVLNDLESLGWGSKNELRYRVMSRQQQPTIEREFYKLLKKRRDSRLQQLAVLSPKVNFVRSTSEPVSSLDSLKLEVLDKAPSDCASPSMLTHSEMIKQHSALTIESTTSSTAENSLTLSPFTLAPSQEQAAANLNVRQTSTSFSQHQNSQSNPPAAAVNTSVNESYQMPFLELGAAATYQRVTDSQPTTVSVTNSVPATASTTVASIICNPSEKTVNQHHIIRDTLVDSRDTSAALFNPSIMQRASHPAHNNLQPLYPHAAPQSKSSASRALFNPARSSGNVGNPSIFLHPPKIAFVDDMTNYELEMKLENDLSAAALESARESIRQVNNVTHKSTYNTASLHQLRSHSSGQSPRSPPGVDQIGDLRMMPAQTLHVKIPPVDDAKYTETPRFHRQRRISKIEHTTSPSVGPKKSWFASFFHG